MKCRLEHKVLLLLLMSSLLLVSNSEAYIETFNSNNAGWLSVTANNSGNTPSAPATWNSTGGNGGGYVSGVVDSDDTRLYGIQAPSVANSFGDLTGQTLTVDYKIDGTVYGPSGATVRFYVGHFDGQSRYWVSNNAYSWAPNADTIWTTHQVALLESNFTVWPNQNNGTMTFSEVLKNYNDIGLVFADGFISNATLGFSGNATIGVDNFGAVPIPGAVWLLGSGLVGLVGLRKRS